jgi:uncharacterized membrane protein YphA (DoxX/SURF4 family)
MSQNGVAPTLVPLVILTHLGGGILVLIGVKARCRLALVRRSCARLGPFQPGLTR